MNIKPILLSVLLIGAIAVSGCQNGRNLKTESVQDAQHIREQQMRTLRNPNIIPSAGHMKVQTTNELGKTSYGMGSNVYSVIGSSGLHSEGLSQHLESRLSGMGINNVSVFVFDDSVVLAAAKRELTASQYDPMQEKVLSGTGGFSGRGTEPNSRIGTFGAGEKVSADNIDMAEKQIETLIGGSVHVIKIVNPEAVKTIKQIRSYSENPEAHPSQIADGINKLLRLAPQMPQK
ncbi:hypothetical protein ACFOLF_29740 [Paenibacillus sepulcri]|uniref:Sporulation lipoprotein, YhcN/YlaJ family n=1 Tax=Paenibacillus sepulcri TaxID=359917 RepID=A0ABS7CA22_9BACL|nr:hypothetical protein [Paenibacillus sepulcri]